MRRRNPNSPWNPAYSVEVTPKEFEEQVVNWLRSGGESPEKFKANHLQHLSGAGGDYEFDAVAEFIILGGAQVIILVECKRHSRPVEREHWR